MACACGYHLKNKDEIIIAAKNISIIIDLVNRVDSFSIAKANN